MVEIKIENQEIIFRVILAGRQKSTKFATVRELHDCLLDAGAENLTVMHAGGDRVVGFRWPLEDDDNLFGMKVMIDVMARPGELHSLANDVLIYRAADAIIYLDDRDPGDDESANCYAGLIKELEGLARKPEELPLLVQTYDDADSDRDSLFLSRKSPWKPEMHKIGMTTKRPVDVLYAAKARVLANYRGYESELSKRGLEGHIKIRDRVYECVPVDPCIVPAADELGQEVRLIPSLARRGSEGLLTTRVLIGIAIATTILAAVAVSLTL